MLLFSFEIIDLIFQVIYKKSKIQASYPQIDICVNMLQKLWLADSIDWLKLINYKTKNIQLLLLPLIEQQPVVFFKPIINIIHNLCNDNKCNILLGQCGIVSTLLLLFSFNYLNLCDNDLIEICEILCLVFKVSQNRSILLHCEKEIIIPFLRKIDSNNEDMVNAVLKCCIEITKDRSGFCCLTQFNTFIYTIVEFSLKENDYKKLADIILNNWIGDNDEHCCLLNELSTDSLFYLLQCNNQSLVVQTLKVLYERLSVICKPMKERVISPIKSGWIDYSDDSLIDDDKERIWKKKWCIIDTYMIYIYDYKLGDNIIGPYLEITNSFNLQDANITTVKGNSSYIYLSNKNIISNIGFNIYLKGIDNNGTKRWLKTLSFICIYFIYLVNGGNATPEDTILECDVNDINFQNQPYLYESRNCLIPQEIRPYIDNLNLV